jgi:hypothetical protein
MLRAMARVCDDLETQPESVCGLHEWLAPEEIAALIERMRNLIANPVMPDLRRRRSVPWSFR